jgi:hypothetical protein
VKILTVGKKGREQLRATMGELIGHVDLSDVKRVGYANAADIAQDVLPASTPASSTWRRSSSTASSR